MISARLTFAVYLLAATAGALLYRTSYAVDEVSAKIAETNRQIIAEQGNVQVLGAEWTYLTEPSRIEALASKYLHLETTKTQRVAGLHDMNRVVGQRAEPTLGTVIAPAVVALAQPPLIAPKVDVVADAAPMQVAKPVVTAKRAASPLLNTVAQKQLVQPTTTPNSVKLLLASFQAN